MNNIKRYKINQGKNKLSSEAEKKAYNKKCIGGSFLLLYALITGIGHGMDKSVLTIFMNNPKKSVPYIIIAVVGSLLGYIFLWVTRPKKYK